jgi:hypothetical protein
MFMPPENSDQKTGGANEPEFSLGAFSSPATIAKEGVPSADAMRTMRKDISEAKMHQDPSVWSVERPAGTNPFSAIWSKVSGKEKAEKEAATLAAKKELIRAKEETEVERVRAKEEAAVKQIRAKAIAEAEAAAEKARAQADAEAAAIATERERVDAEARAVIEKEMGHAYAEIATSPEGAAVRDRAVATASTKAAAIIATHGKALSETALETAEIIEEKEKIRTAVAKIVEEEEKALDEITKLVEKEEEERATLIKAEASQKRARAEAAADAAETSLIKERAEADEAEILAKKERAEAMAAEILAKKERERANEALKTEAKEIFTADKQVQIAVDAATKEVILLQNRARSEAEVITLAQEKARQAEAAEMAEISAIEKRTHTSSNTI